jgi:hypothetical protein
VPWQEVDAVLDELEQLQPAVNLYVTPYISALNIWWLQDWVQRFQNWRPEQIRPIFSRAGDNLGVGIIPWQYRSALIDQLQNSPFAEQFATAVEQLQTVDETASWENFLQSQRELDAVRNEKFVDLLSQHLTIQT